MFEYYYFLSTSPLKSHLRVRSLKILTGPDSAHQRCAPLCVLYSNNLDDVVCGWSQAWQKIIVKVKLIGCRKDIFFPLSAKKRCSQVF